MSIPATIEFKRAFLIAFALVVSNDPGYDMLDDDDLTDQDPDEVRELFDSALSETASRFDIACTAENLGELSDIVLETWKAIDEFLIATTDSHLRDDNA